MITIKEGVSARFKATITNTSSQGGVPIASSAYIKMYLKKLDNTVLWTDPVRDGSTPEPFAPGETKDFLGVSFTLNDVVTEGDTLAAKVIVEVGTQGAPESIISEDVTIERTYPVIKSYSGSVIKV